MLLASAGADRCFAGARRYMGWGSDGSIWFASEMKCLIEDCKVRPRAAPPPARPPTTVGSIRGDGMAWDEANVSV
jgi:hypothetical protein